MDDRSMWRPNPPPVYCYPQNPGSYPGQGPSGVGFPVPHQPNQTVHSGQALGAWPGPMYSSPPPIQTMPVQAPPPSQGHRDPRLAYARPPQAYQQPRSSTTGAVPREAYQTHGRGNQGFRPDSSGPGAHRGGGGGRGRSDGRRYNQNQSSVHLSQVSRLVYTLRNLDQKQL